MLGLLGWVLVGLVVGAFVYFWDDIKEWLDTTAADVVQDYIGYSARKALQKATCYVDRVINNLRTRAVVFYKRHPLDIYYDKVTLESTADVSEFDDQILREIQEKKVLVQEFEYKG